MKTLHKKKRIWPFVVMPILILGSIIYNQRVTLALPPTPSLALVVDARPKSVIVTADKPGVAVALGARVLAEHLLQISGAQVPVVAESALQGIRVAAGKIGAGGEETFILIGESNLTKQLGVTAQGLGAGGIRLQTTGNALILLGADLPSDRNATLYAVTTFLEEQLGVRYLWPGESGKVVPQQRSIRIPLMKYEYSPTIIQRRIRLNGFNERDQVGLNHLKIEKEEYLKRLSVAEKTVAASSGWYTWQHLGGSAELASGHAFGYMWKKYGAEHPEWFALQPNGSRDQSASPDRSRLCVSNQELQEAIARDKIAELERNPRQTSVSLSPNDGGATTFCMCPECKKLDPPEGRPIQLWDHSGKERTTFPYVSLTDRMVAFWNGIAQRVTAKHPNALFSVYAYSVYSAPPLRNKLHPNIVVWQVSGDYFNPARTQSFLNEWTQWSKAAKRLAWRPNLDANNRRHGFPTIYVHRMAQDFKLRAHAGMVSTDIDSTSKSWATNGLNLYVLARLHWNPDLDVDALVDDYCRTGFGPGASLMREYFNRLEEITDASAAAALASPKPNTRGATMITALARAYDAPTMAALHGLLDQAQQAAAADAAIVKRIAFLRRGLQLADVQAQAFRLQDENDAKTLRARRAEVLAFMTKRYGVMRDIVENDVLAVSIPYLLWGGEGNFRALQSPQSWKVLAGPEAAGSAVKTETKTVVDADENGMPEEQTALAKP